MIRNKLIYIGTFFCILFVLIMYPSRYIAVVVRIMLLLPILSWIQLQYMARKLEVGFRVPGKRIQREDERGIPLELQIKNKSWFPVLLGEMRISYFNLYQAPDQQQERIPFGAAGADTTTTTYQLYARNSGIVQITPEQVYIYDFLRIWKKKIKLDVSEQVAVMPKLRKEPNLTFSIPEQWNMETEYYAQERPGDDSSEVFGIREYRPGDKLRSIHWKLSSKQDKMMVKEFGYPISKSTLLFVELWMPDTYMHREHPLLWHDAVDGFLDKVGSLLLTMTEQERCIELGCYFVDKQEILSYQLVSEADVYTGMEYLMEGSFYNTAYGVGQYLAFTKNRSYRYILYVSTHWNESLLQQLAMEQKQCRLVFLWLPETASDDEQKAFETGLQNYGLMGQVIA